MLGLSGVREDGVSPSLPRNCKHGESGNWYESHWEQFPGKAA